MSTRDSVRLQVLHPVTEAANQAIDDPDAAVAAEDRPGRPDRPWIYTNMVGSIDGASAIADTSGALGDAGDAAVFRSLRAVADVILVGASTVRAENYRPPTISEANRERRHRRGQDHRPTIAVVTTSLDLDPNLPLLTDPTYRPLIITARRSLERHKDRAKGLEAAAEVMEAGDDKVDLTLVPTLLGRRGARLVLCEGGPSLNGQLVAHGLIDEWNLTLSPLLVAGQSSRVAVGPEPNGPPESMRLDRVWLHDHHLFCRWTRRIADSPD